MVGSSLSSRSLDDTQVPTVSNGVAAANGAANAGTMKRVSFCGSSFLTTDEVADALLQLVAVLAHGHGSEMLEIPAVGSDGKTVIVQLVVGPTSELLTIPEEVPSAEPNTADAVAYLRDHAQTLADPRQTESAVPFLMTDYDWDDIG